MKTEHIRIGIEGMTCANCANRVAKALDAIPGVLQADVNIAIERADIVVPSGRISRKELEGAISDAGYRPIPASENDAARETQSARRELVWLCASVALAMPFIFQMTATALGFNTHLPPFAEFILKYRSFI